MKTVIIIKADENDADYVYNFLEENQVRSIDKVISTLKKLSAAMYENKVYNNIYHNWCTGERADMENSPYEMYKDMLTEEEIETVNEIVPFSEYGIHTIKSIRILKVEEDEELVR